MLSNQFKVLILLLGVIGIHCLLIGNDVQIPWSGKIYLKEGVKTVINPGNPFFDEIELKLEENLVLRYGKDEVDIFGWITGVELDKDDNIFLLDAAKYRISSFDKNGNHRLHFGRKGVGPGEFRNLFDFFIGKNGKIYVLDARIIHIFDSQGNFKKQIKLKNTAYDFFVNDEYDFIISLIEVSKNIREKVVCYFSHDFKIKKEIARFHFGKVVRRNYDGKIKVRSFYVPHVYTPDILFQRTFDNSFVLGYSSDYSLMVLSKKGETLLRIEKEELPSPISSEEKEKIYGLYAPIYEKKWSKQVLKEAIQFLPHRPFYKKILVDDKGRIYVGRLGSILEWLGKRNRVYIFDVFDKEGYYIHKIKIPIKPYKIKDKYLYAVDKVNNEEDFVIKRFKIVNWAEIKENKSAISGR